MEGIHKISFCIYGTVSLDLVRAKEDPWFESFCAGYDLEDPEQLKLALTNYINAYIANEDILGSEIPWSCGPSSITHTNIEVK